MAKCVITNSKHTLVFLSEYSQQYHLLIWYKGKLMIEWNFRFGTQDFYMVYSKHVIYKVYLKN